MLLRFLFLFLTGMCMAACGRAQSSAPDGEQAPSMDERRVAVTVDDLPGVFRRGTACDPEALRDITGRLVEGLVSNGIPATGFVNESKICERHRGELMPQLLTMWLEAGQDLGNHTYSHRGFHADPGGLPDPDIEEYRLEIVRGEAVTRRLLADRGREPRYFRHPYLRTGLNDERKAAFDSLLADLGYNVAPVTIDNSEWVYAGAYARALSRDDSAAAVRIGAAYLEHMAEMFAFFEQLSLDVAGRDIPQILLIHANDLNADYMDELAALMRDRGYAFVRLEEALEDSIYRRPDVYTGPRGRSWLQRWYHSESGEIRPEPVAPDWVWSAMR